MQYLVFLISLSILLISASYFTKSAELIGKHLRLPQFVIGVFIVGIGTSLPELISGFISIKNGSSEILSGNIIGANISNILLITGLIALINKKEIVLKQSYIFIDLHYLIGSFLFFYVIAYDGNIEPIESSIGLGLFIAYSFYLIKGGNSNVNELANNLNENKIPIKAILILFLCAVGIYYGANYVVISLENIALNLSIPRSIIALTVLSLGTTLPELAVNISAIRQGKAEMAIGNILGSSIFNTLVIPSTLAFLGEISVTENLLHFSLPFMVACGVLFYLLTQDKRISIWEGLLFIGLYVLFILKSAF